MNGRASFSLIHPAKPLASKKLPVDFEPSVQIGIPNFISCYSVKLCLTAKVTSLSRCVCVCDELLRETACDPTKCLVSILSLLLQLPSRGITFAAAASLRQGVQNQSLPGYCTKIHGYPRELIVFGRFSPYNPPSTFCISNGYPEKKCGGCSVNALRFARRHS